MEFIDPLDGSETAEHGGRTCDYWGTYLVNFQFHPGKIRAVVRAIRSLDYLIELIRIPVIHERVRKCAMLRKLLHIEPTA